MNIVFISKRKDHNYAVSSENLDEVKKYLQSHDVIHTDTEYSSHDPYRATLLLLQIGDQNIQYVIDATSIDVTELVPYFKSQTFVGHNIKADYKVLKMLGFSFRKIYDTMLADQMITNGTGLRASLDEVASRRLKIPPLDKTVRKDFSGADKSFVFGSHHIKYAAEDVWVLPQIVEAQKFYLDKYGYRKDLEVIEFPYCTLIADAELEGFKLDEAGWKEIIKEMEQESVKIKQDLDNILLDLREDYEELRKLKIPKARSLVQTEQQNLFTDSTIYTSPNKNFINYNSTDQILEIFMMVEGYYPQFKKKNEKTGKKEWANSAGEESLELFIKTHSDSPLAEFAKKVIDLSKAQKVLSSFGERFLRSEYRRRGKKTQPGYKNPITGKVHTSYFQLGTDTTRMSSGNEKDGYYNSQNIKKAKKWRHCFIADEGREIGTVDLQGAELVIGASLSGDRRLIELTQGDDLHSPIADEAYARVTEYIINHMHNEDRKRQELYDVLYADHEKLGITRDEAERITWERVEETLKNKKFNITKQTANDIRDKFKNVNYSLVYGGSYERIMDLLNIAEHYAKIVESSMKDMFPTFFKYLDANSAFGVYNGYIKFHEDWGSRHIFNNVLQYKSWGKDLPFSIKGEVERACKNYPIQGTQGLMLKEASNVFYYDYVFPNNYDVKPKLWVHDEHVASIVEGEHQHIVMLSDIMNEVGTRYLKNGVQMKSSYKILKSWTK